MDRAKLADAKALLYGQPIDTFIAERDVLVKQIRVKGDRNLANEVKALRKPSAIAAEVNQIVRADPDGIELILQAAALLRAAQAGALDGSSINTSELQQQYREAIRALAQSAPNKRAEVRAALEAATIDEASNEDLRSGCLVVVPTPVSMFGTAAQSSDKATTPPQEQVDELAERRARRRTRDKAEQADANETAKRDKANAEAEAEQQRVAEAELQRDKEAEAKAARTKAAQEQRVRKRKQAKLKKAHREAVRAHLAALDDEQTATSALEQAQQHVAKADDERETLEQALAAAVERSAQATVEHRAAEKAGADARDRAAAAEAEVETLAAAIDAVTTTESA